MNIQVTNKTVVAVFDFDRTITDRHTFWRFLRMLIGRPKFFLIALTLIPTAVLLALKVISLMAARDVMIRRCMTGICANKYRELGLVFARQEIPKWIKPEAMERFQWHKSQGHRCLLISNSADVYLEPWGQMVGFDAISGSHFREHNGKLTGQLDGPHCQAEEKVVRVRQILGNPQDYEIHAYGDSEGDRNLLDIAAYPYYRSFTNCAQ